MRECDREFEREINTGKGEIGVEYGQIERDNEDLI